MYQVLGKALQSEGCVGLDLGDLPGSWRGPTVSGVCMVWANTRADNRMLAQQV